MVRASPADCGTQIAREPRQLIRAGSHLTANASSTNNTTTSHMLQVHGSSFHSCMFGISKQISAGTGAFLVPLSTIQQLHLEMSSSSPQTVRSTCGRVGDQVGAECIAFLWLPSLACPITTQKMATIEQYCPIEGRSRVKNGPVANSPPCATKAPRRWGVDLKPCAKS